MSWGYWRPYVPVAKRRANAAREMVRLAKQTGRAIEPVRLEGRTIARTFWGKAWCTHLESYSDFANRLPRGRTYVRNGSVVDLQIERGRIAAHVSGSEVYQIEIRIEPLSKAAWKGLCRECSGGIDSLLELLQGRLSAGVMQVVTRRDGGLFPKPSEIRLDCSCPDWAGLCKHLAAVLYGVGARLDEKPELLFLLRGVDPADLITEAGAAEAIQQTVAGRAGTKLDDAELTEVFGIELDVSPAAVPKRTGREQRNARAATRPKGGSRRTVRTGGEAGRASAGSAGKVGKQAAPTASKRAVARPSVTRAKPAKRRGRRAV